MKKLLTGIILLSMLAAILSFGVSAASDAIVNGGFEGEELYEGMGVARPNDGSSTLEITSQLAHSGSNSLYVTNRSNQWGAVSWDVSDYIKAQGTGKYYSTLYVNGTFDGSIRITLHTRYTDGTDIYRNAAAMTNFYSNQWTYVGTDANGTPLALGAEDWSKDYADWDKDLNVENLDYAILYFWIEGDDYSDIYFDDVNFWKEGDTPIDYNPSVETDAPATEAPVTDAPATDVPAPETSDMLLPGAIVLGALAAAAFIAVKKRG